MFEKSDYLWNKIAGRLARIMNLASPETPAEAEALLEAEGDVRMSETRIEEIVAFVASQTAQDAPGATSADRDAHKARRSEFDETVGNNVLDRVMGCVTGWVQAIKEMLPQHQGAQLGDAADSATCEVRVSSPPACSPAAKWLDQVKVIRQSDGNWVRYRAQAVSIPDAPDAPKVLLVALVAPNGARSEVKLDGNMPKTFNNTPTHSWDELTLEVGVPNDA